MKINISSRFTHSRGISIVLPRSHAVIIIVLYIQYMRCYRYVLQKQIMIAKMAILDVEVRSLMHNNCTKEQNNHLKCKSSNKSFKSVFFI